MGSVLDLVVTVADYGRGVAIRLKGSLKMSCHSRFAACRIPTEKY